jgi:GNAT superfamily N-acetyltransferase
MGVEIRLGTAADADDALAVYERSNSARRGGNWPHRAERLRQVAANLRDPSSWFLVGRDGDGAVAMAVVLPFRAERGTGPLVPGIAFLDLIYVDPDRWGEGIGNTLLRAVVDEAARREARKVVLWTHERGNVRAQRLYVTSGFERSGNTGTDDDGEPVAEWVRDP